MRVPHELRGATVVLLVVVLAAAACDGSGASTTTPATTTPATTTPVTTTSGIEPPGIPLVPYTDPLYGLSTMVPDGWVENPGGGIGVLTPPEGPDAGALLAVQFVNGTGAGVVSTALRSELGLTGPLEPVGTLESGALSWNLFAARSESPEFGDGPIGIDAALAESEGGVYLVLLASAEEQAELLRASVFLPAVEALIPPERPAVEPGATYLDPTAAIDDRVEDLLARMSLREKIGQMTLVEKDSIVVEDIAALGIGGLLSGGGGSPETNSPEAWADMVDGFQERALESPLAIPLIYGVDAVHGHNNVRGAVVFPHNIGLGATGDPELVERIGRITAVETAATGIYWNYAPVVAVPQDLRWGRMYEAYGEDTDLVTGLGTAFLRGLQGTDLSDRSSVLATPKHFVGDGGTAWGSSTSFDYPIDQGVARIDEETLRAVHLPPYTAAIDAGALSIMASFSSWDGLKMHAHRYLLTDVLKGEMGFEGFVVSDWAGIDQISDDYGEAVVIAVNAGIDMVMVPSRYREFMGRLIRAVDGGEVPQDRIDDAVRRILRAKFELGLFEEPMAERSLLGRVGSEEHRAVAQEAVSRSLVLLKNDNATLPISNEVDEIFVGGQAADDIGIQSGGWTIEWQGATGAITEGTTILEGIASVAPEGVVVYHDTFGRLDRVDSAGADPDPDVCIAVVGERPYAEGRGDLFEPAIVDRDLAVLANMRDACERLVVLLVTGRPLFVTDLLDAWDALVVAWLPGSEGDGVARVLFGDEPFTGRLSVTWPSSVEQLPLGEGEGDPLFPVGFGLSASGERVEEGTSP